MNQLSILLLSSALLGACGGGAPSQEAHSFPSTPYATLLSDTGALQIEVRTLPAQPLERGVASVQLSVRSADGAPVEGLTIDMVPWMPAMGHGASRLPTVTAQGQGVYQLDDVDVFMPGLWELRTTLAQNSSMAHVTPSFDVP